MLDFLFKIHFFELLSGVSLLLIFYVIYYLYLEKKIQQTNILYKALNKNEIYFPYLLLIVLIVNLIILFAFKNLNLYWLQSFLYIIAIISGGLALFNYNQKEHGRK
jgi:hypothetical protein